jgi:hypothetical protein
MYGRDCSTCSRQSQPVALTASNSHIVVLYSDDFFEVGEVREAPLLVEAERKV